MSTLVLHIGLHKTGSTSIQNSLKGYSAARIKYLDLRLPNHSIPIYAAFTDDPNPEKDGVHARVGRTAENLSEMRRDTLARLHAELSKSGFDKFVISGEGITRLSRASLEEFKALLLKYVDTVSVFAYVRDPAGFAISDFQQRIKAGYSGYDLAKPKYRQRLEKFLQVFGRDNFSAKVFAKDGLKDGSVVLDFCDVWGIPFEAKDEVRANESLSLEAVQLLHLFNRHGPQSKGTPSLFKGRQLFIRALAEHFTGKFSPPPQFRGAAFDIEDMAWLHRELGISFDVEAPAETPRPAEFRKYLENIDEKTIESYRRMLQESKFPTQPGDGALDLLNRHYEACVASADSTKDRLRRFLQRGKAGQIHV